MNIYWGFAKRRKLTARDCMTRTSPQPADTPATARKLRTTIDRQRSQFLRQCRARLEPGELGLPDSRRARGGGVRREDVAAQAGVSISWYTWLEQGRDIRVSDEVLERISRTLRLSATEHTYLFSLVQQRPPRSTEGMLDTAPDEMFRLVQAIPFPAVVLNLRCDVLAWNRINSILYRDYDAMAPEDRNLLEILLIKPVAHLSPDQQESMAKQLLGRLRFDFSKYPDDPQFNALLRRLFSLSPVFARVWRDSDFALRAYGPYTFRHPRFGEVTFEHTSYIPDGHPSIRIVTCTPLSESAVAAVATVNAELAAGHCHAPG